MLCGIHILALAFPGDSAPSGCGRASLELGPGSSSPWGCSPLEQGVIPSEILGKRAVGGKMWRAWSCPGLPGWLLPVPALEAPRELPRATRALSQTSLQTSALFEVCPSLLRSLPGISSTRQAGLFPN